MEKYCFYLPEMDRKNEILASVDCYGMMSAAGTENDRSPSGECDLVKAQPGI